MLKRYTSRLKLRVLAYKIKTNLEKVTSMQSTYPCKHLTDVQRYSAFTFCNSNAHMVYV